MPLVPLVPTTPGSRGRSVRRVTVCSRRQADSLIHKGSVTQSTVTDNAQGVCLTRLTAPFELLSALRSIAT